MNDAQQRLAPVGEPDRSNKTRQEGLPVQSGVEVGQGFRGGLKTQNHEIVVEELAVEGHIPEWLVGSLIRNTPAQYEIGARSYRHWFDGLSMLHSFTFEQGRVSYRNRFLQSKGYRENNETGEIKFLEFATDPKQTLFHRLLTTFQKPDFSNNTNVNVTRYGDRFVALTEIPVAMVFDVHTLETLDVYDYETDAQIGTAHPHFDFARNMGFTYMAKIGISSEYRFHSLIGNKLNLLATVPTKKLAYIHSFGMTEHYLLLAEYALKIPNVLLMLAQGKPFIEKFEWLPDEGSRFIVVDKTTGKIVSESQTEAFFAFHHINAFERDGEIIADFAAYPDADILNHMYLDKLRADGASLTGGEFRRYRIPLSGNKRSTYELVTDENIEFPRINYDRSNSKPYGCVFGASIKHGMTDFYNQLTKFDVATGAVKKWHEANCYPGEPVFVAAPEASTEDAGAVLSVVFDSQSGTSFLLVLDGQSFEEIARISVPQHIPFGFHGQFFGKK
jgi:beta,beta-carotene 9',10'-dioxygenase